MKNSQQIVKKNSFRFSIQVWATGVLIPALFWGLAAFYNVESIALKHIWDALFTVVIVGISSTLFSVPSWLLLWAIVTVVNRQNWNVWTKKTGLCLFSLILTVGAFALMNVFTGDVLLRDYAWKVVLGYAATICMAIVYFDLEPRSPVLSNELLDQIPEG